MLCFLSCPLLVASTAGDVFKPISLWSSKQVINKQVSFKIFLAKYLRLLVVNVIQCTGSRPLVFSSSVMLVSTGITKIYPIQYCRYTVHIMKISLPFRWEFLGKRLHFWKNTTFTSTLIWLYHWTTRANCPTQKHLE